MAPAEVGRKDERQSRALITREFDRKDFCPGFKTGADAVPAVEHLPIIYGDGLPQTVRCNVRPQFGELFVLHRREQRAQTMLPQSAVITVPVRPVHGDVAPLLWRSQ